MKRSWKMLTVMALVFVGLAAFTVRWMMDAGEKPAAFRTATVTRGELLATISATGTVEPEEVVDVGAQVAGKILSFGKDLAGSAVDYGSFIEEGTVLARIDDSLYSSDVAQSRAQLAQAKAAVVKAEADLGQLQAKLTQAERDWGRAKKLGPSDALARADYEASQSGFDVAKSNLQVGKATLLQQKSAVAQAEASLGRVQQNLDYCTIKSPVKGVIIDRRVNIGQTVVASLNAPSLFLIAKDLKRLQVWVPVNEADIGNIRPGQEVSFTVDAQPGEVFEGEVGKVRLNASMTQNVVTYTVEVITDNTSGKLLPYLSANVKFLVNRKPDVLLVPNAALRWVPKPEQVVESSTPTAERKRTGGSGARDGDSGKGKDAVSRGQVWVASGALVKPVPIVLGATDGSVTEVSGDAIKEGMQVILGEQRNGDSENSQASSPFAPKLFRGGRR